VIKFEDVTKIYPPSTVGLERVTLHIEKGEFVFLVDPLVRVSLRSFAFCSKRFSPTGDE